MKLRHLRTFRRQGGRPSTNRRRRFMAGSLRERLWSPPAHWRLLGFCLLVVAIVIFFEGIVTHRIGPTTEPAPTGGAAPLANAPSAVLAADGDSLASYGPRKHQRQVVLTFDDGPDPRWTPKISAYLHRQGIPAMFFVIGSSAAQHPEIVRRLISDGHEVGNHTFTHTALSRGPTWYRQVQLNYSEAVIVGITGHYSRFIRPPYSATLDSITAADERNLAALAGKRYLYAFTDFDAEDWRRKGVQKIVKAALPPHGRSGIILLHDGGGNRSQTLAAVKILVPRLRDAGYEFSSLSAYAGLSRAELEPAASRWQHVRALGFTAAVRGAFLLTGFFSVLIVAIGVMVGLRVLLLLALALHHSRGSRRRFRELEAPGATLYLPPVAVVIPAYNEEAGIERAVRSLSTSDYPDFEVIVVDDGSTDRTAEIAAELERALPNVRLVRRDNGGKAAALNSGIAASQGEVVVMVDGDTIFERETLRRLVQPLEDPAVGAVAGNTKVGNRGGLLGRWQHIEYVMGFNLDRRMYEILQCTPTVPGAIGAFRRSVLDEIGGVSGATLAEDTDLTLAIGRAGHKVLYVDRALAWTEAPSSFTGLWRQRYRWSYGTMQSVWKHKAALWSRDPRQKRIGRRALPYMIFFQIALPVVAPLIDLFALYGVIFGDSLQVTVYWLLFNLVQLVVAGIAFRIDGEKLRPLWALPLQQFVYRQLMYLVIIESSISALVGVRAGWKHIERTGDVEVGGSTRRQPRPESLAADRS